MCDVPSIAVFCSESIECFPDIVSKFFLKLLVTIPVAPIITGTIVHFRFHIRCTFLAPGNIPGTYDCYSLNTFYPEIDTTQITTP